MTASEARGSVPRALKVPNRVLRGVRENERHETRAEFAEAMTRVALEMGEDVHPDAKYVEKLESGLISWPRPSCRDILVRLCGRPIGELGFTAPVLSSSRNAGDPDNPVAPHLNKALRDAVLASGMEVTHLAREVGVHPKSAQRWITGGRIPHAAHRWKACQVLGREESELWPDVHVMAKKPPARGSPEPAGNRMPANLNEVSQTQRRDFLLLGGAAAAASLPGILEGELNKIHVTLSRRSTNDERLAYLEQCADDLGVKVATAAPMETLRPALAALASVRDLLEERQPPRYQARLVAISAKLSLVIGIEAFNTGNASQARQWHKTAQWAASDAGIQYLSDIALAQQAFTPLYAGKPAEVVRLTSPRLDAGPAPSPAIAQLWGITARAHAALGDKENFRRSIGNGWNCLEHSAPERIGPGILSFHPANLAWYETTSAVTLNELDNSLDAAARALALFTATESLGFDRALVGLERACALARAGEIGEACRSAKAVVLDPGTFDCAPVREYTRKFSKEIRSAASPDAREWHEMLAAIEKDHAEA